MKKGFSLIELLVSLIAISVLVAAMTPVLTKRIANQKTALNASFTTSCSSINDDCKLCKKGKCLVCTKRCSNTQYLDTESCSCKACSSLVGNCSSCTSKGCTMCNSGYGLNVTGNTSCTQCTSGTYSTGNSPCKTCESGTYNQANGQNSCLDCPRGFKCSGGSDKTQCLGTTFSEAKSLACYNCPDGYVCSGGIRNNCPSGFYCKGGVQSPCGDFGAACTQCGVSGCTQKNCAVFGACTECTPTSCIAAGCANGVLSGIRCENCPSGYYCHNGAKVNCSTFGTTCSNCNSTGCTSCSGGYNLTGGRCLAPVAAPEIKCSDFDPYCSECDNTKCTKCKSGYLDNGKCIQNCEAFGPNCRSCDEQGCKFCGTGYKIKYYNRHNYCVLNFSRSVIPWSEVNHISYYNLAPGLEFFERITDKCSSPNAPCCWHFNAGPDSTIVCNFYGALNVCATSHLGNARLPDSTALASYVQYLNNHQDTTAGLTGSGVDGDIVHALVVLSMVDEYKMCRDNVTADGSWCKELANKCCYADSSIPCSCVPFGMFASEYGSIMTLHAQTARMGGYSPTVAARIMCYK